MRRSMNRPIVREEAFRFCFAWLERERGAAELVRDQFGALELLLLLAVTDTWSAVRKASARSIERALAPLLDGRARAAVRHDDRDLPRPRQRRRRRARRRRAGDASASGGSSLRRRPGAAAAGAPPPVATSSPAAPSAAAAQQGAWRAHEGLVMGIGALVAIAAGSARLSATERRRLLVHMCEHMRPTLYRLLAHPQIAVRQTAEATFSPASAPPPRCRPRPPPTTTRLPTSRSSHTRPSRRAWRS